jgi:hypothetical protein
MANAQQGATRAAEPTGFTIRKRKNSRWWEVLDPEGQLVCLTVYRRGAREVVRRLTM